MRKLPPPEPVPEWTVRYTFWLDNDLSVTEDRTFSFDTEDKVKAAGNLMLAYRWDRYGVISGGVLYPPHRVRRVTWEVLP